MGSAFDEELVVQIRNNNQSQRIVNLFFNGNKTSEVSCQLFIFLIFNKNNFSF